MTASDAAQHNARHSDRTPFVSLTQVLEERATSSSEQVAAGFATSKGDGLWSWDTFTFGSLWKESSSLAAYLATTLQLPVRTEERGQERMIIALLCPSNAEFLLILCACWRLGLGVLLLAPQNTPQAVSHLCHTTQSTHLLYHASMSALALSSYPNPSSSDGPRLVEIPDRTDWDIHIDVPQDRRLTSSLTFEQEADTVAIVFHTSGSSGVPKPIYQNHRLWTEPLPCVPHSPAFTTTPLFHGGLSDFFRSLNSKSALYIFPSSLPITSVNIVSALSSSDLSNTPTSFLSVPYIIQLLAETEPGLKLLKSFELVSTGGSPMPKDVGDRLVQEDVRLVSRYGSSECGFLMSSHREYETDKEWSYLRTTDEALRQLTFESYDDEEFSLIVGPEWPSKCVSNQQDGSYVTGDLFIKHPTIKHAWLLSGRSDDVLVMVNGEKTSPVPLETSLVQSPLISDAVLFGANRVAIGALIIPSSTTTTFADLLSVLDKTNDLAPSHSQISPELLVILPTDATFFRASKGSLQRGRTYQVFEQEIVEAYRKFESGDETHGAELESRWEEGADITALVKEVVEIGCGLTDKEKSLGVDDDLFAFGVNSLQSTRIRNILQKKFPFKNTKLASNIVYECSTIRRLAEHITALLTGGESTQGPSLDERELESMELLSERFGKFERKQEETPLSMPTEENIILTGATGSLGAHLLAQLLSQPNVNNITLLIRADSVSHSTERVQASLLSRKLSYPQEAWEKKVCCLPADLAQLDLGVGQDVWERLAKRTTLVIHAAWSVNFVGRLEGFVPHLQGLCNLIKTITQPTSSSCSRFYFCSSTASILNQPFSAPLLEEVSLQNKDAVPMGYGSCESQTSTSAVPLIQKLQWFVLIARSKWVAERICLAASESCLKKGRIGILRLGQLSADTKEGIWNETEGWPLMFSSVGVARTLPGLEENPAWLPVDKAASSILEILLGRSSYAELPLVFHIAATNLSTPFSSILEWFHQAGVEFDVVEPKEWVRRLREAEDKGQEKDCFKLLDLWESTYQNASNTIGTPVFDARNAGELSPTIRQGTAISEELVKKMVEGWMSSGFVTAR